MDVAGQPSQSHAPSLGGIAANDLVAAAAEVIEVQSIRHLRADPSDRSHSQLTPSLAISGRLRLPPERAYDLVSERFRALGHIAFLRRNGDDHVILAAPGLMPVVRSRGWLALGLFLATLLSVFYAGGARQAFSFADFDMASGLSFAASLLGILLAHEFGHYLVARRLGVPATLPYFIPLPISLFGTMGAFIQMKAPPKNKRGLFAVAIAGPLAGMVVALPVLIVGLMLSPVEPLPAGGYLQEGNSLFYAGIKFLVFGRFLPSGGEDVFLHPMALAGWAGLLVTGLNLIPAGQLDGGHIVYALLGEKAQVLTQGVIVVLLGLGILWQGWFLWAALVYLFGRTRPAPFDDVTSLRPRERAIAILAILLFVLVFSPLPMVIH